MYYVYYTYHGTKAPEVQLQSENLFNRIHILIISQ
jgi:hypothetical protein